MTSSSLRELVLACGALCALACAAGPAGSTAHASDGSESSGASDGSGEPNPSRSPAAHCSGESCFVCGAGLCPVGFYCDEALQGGAGCSWLPECAGQASCGCVQPVLGAACRCEERSGGVYVSCD